MEFLQKCVTEINVLRLDHPVFFSIKVLWLDKKGKQLKNKIGRYVGIKIGFVCISP